MPTIGAADGAAHPEAPLGEVEAVAHLPPDAVVGHPVELRPLDAALVDQVVDQPADGVVGERRHDRRPHPEAALQAAGDVVLAASLPRRGTSAPSRSAPRPGRVAASPRRARRDPSGTRPPASDGSRLMRLTPVASRASRVISSNRPSRTSSGRDEPAAAARDHGRHGEVIAEIRRVDPSGRDERHVRVGRRDGPQERRSADLRRREHLHTRTGPAAEPARSPTASPRPGRTAARARHTLATTSSFVPGATAKSAPAAAACADLLDRQHRPGTDEHTFHHSRAARSPRRQPGDET